MRLESGTCNVCSAPCSSCMHLNHALRGPKAEEFSDENCRLGEANNQCSMDEGNVSSLRSRACESFQHAVSETSNILSVTSSHDSLSENAESGQTLSNKYLDSKSLEGHDDNTSCISRASDTNLVNNSHQRNEDRINISCSSIVDSGEKSIANNDSHVDHTAKLSPKVCPKTEADSDNDICDVKDVDRNGSVHDRQHEKTEELVKSPAMQEPQSEDDSDESDVVEHDVKVCDICGDAGREDLLAICSRCSDGAEHTYCMREMLQKVPEGDWLCEECKYAEETENQRLDVEEKKILKASSTSQVSGKRISENMEVAPAAKRQALESSTGSPKASSPKKLAQLLRESSFKSLDKGKVKPGHQIPIRNHSGGDDKEIARSPIGPRDQTSKSTLLKSSSFNNLNSKPRVKLVDEVPPKPKGGGEHTSKNMEKPVRMTTKSTLFKSQSLGRSNATESKVKMFLPKSANAQELKGSRLVKESRAFDRKFLSRIDRPVACSSVDGSVVSTPKGDQKLTPRGETTKPSAVNNNRELKANHDGKFSTLSKSISNISCKSLEPQVSSERTSTSVDEALQEMLPRSRETANQDEKTRDSSSDRVRPVVTTASKSPFCQKCKGFDHSLECCTAGSTQESGAEASVTSSSSSKEEMHKGNRLKAALQAALLRRPEIHKKKEAPTQADEVSTSGTDLNCKVTSQDQVLVYSTLKNSISADERHEQQAIPENSTSDSSKCPSADDLKQLNSCPTGFSSQSGRPDYVDLAAGKPLVRDLSNKALAISSVLSKMSVFPEYEYIWQGVFEVHRNGKPPDLCAGIQAHLSSCASPKVLEVVNKFLPKVYLNEVSRLSMWPSQFHQGGAREDNVALYFFAKDIKSYERHYKDLLDHMIKHDLALKGFFDGVELLIFPSNQLPENSQRWNMLFFLWGVFKGRRINHLDSAEKICIPSLNAVPVEEDSSIAVVALSEMHCSPKRMGEVSVACDKACSEFHPSIDHGQIAVSRNFDINDPTHVGSQGNLEKQDSRIDSNSTSRVPTSSTLLFQEMKTTGSSLKGSVQERGQCRESKPSEALGTSVSSRIVETKTDCEISVKQENASSVEIPSVGNQERGAASNVGREEISERINGDEGQRRSNRKRKEDCHYIDLEAAIGDQEGGAASNSSKDKISGRTNGDEDHQMPKGSQKEDRHYIDLEATIGDQEGGSASNISKDKISERMNGNGDQQRPKRIHKEDDRHFDLEATVGIQERGAASNISMDKIPERMDIDEDQRWPKRNQRENDHYIDLEATFQGDLTVEGVNCRLPNDKVVQYVDLSDTVMQPSSVSCQKVPWKLEGGGSSSKKLKSGFGGIYGSCGSGGRDSLIDSFASLANDLGSRSSSVEGKGCEEACDEKIICEDLGTMERTFFPVDTQNSMSLKGPREYQDRFQDGIPNLELALGGKTNPPPPPKGMLPFFVGAVDRENSQEKHPDLLAEGQEEDGVTASLSLSLSFPSSNKEHTKAASKTELLPDGHPPFLLFGRFTDK